MNRRLVLSLLAVTSTGLWAGSSTAQHSGEEVRSWLDRMNNAVEELNYRGSYVHASEANAETFNIVHRFQDGEVRERICSSEGQGREIIREGDDVRTVRPDRQRVELEQLDGTSTALSGAVRYSDGLSNYYRMKTYTKGKVAGRETQIVSISPRDDYRYGYRIWLDLETALPLRYQIRDSDGDIVEQILFTKIEYVDTIADAELEPEIDIEGFSWRRPIREEYEASSDELWGVERLPAGFRLSAAKRSLLAGSQFPVQHLVYTDGLATVSVFVADPRSEYQLEEGFGGRGSTNSFTLEIDKRLATALGQVPRLAVQLFATSLNAR